MSFFAFPNLKLAAVSPGLGEQPLLWTPEYLETLMFWLDAEDANTVILSGSSVTQWNDKSENNYHASQSLEQSQPIYTQSAFGGKSSLAFDGTDDLLVAPLVDSQARNVSVFIVSKPASTNIRGAVFYPGSGENGYGIGYGSSTFDDTGNNFIFLREFLGWHVGPSFGSADPNIISSVLGTSNIVNYVNGSSILTINAMPYAPTVATGIGGNGAGTRHFQGNIAEIVVISSTSTSERVILEGYLAWKWGLQAELPAEHPYKTAAPIITPFEYPQFPSALFTESYETGEGWGQLADPNAYPTFEAVAFTESYETTEGWT